MDFYNKDAEQALIGSVLIDPRSYFEVSMVDSEFYDVRHQYIWQAIGRVVENQKDIDILTVSDELEVMGKLVDVKPSYVTGMLNVTPSALSIKSYEKTVKEWAVKRKLFQGASKIAQLASSDMPINEMVAKAYAEIDIETSNKRQQSLQEVVDNATKESLDNQQKIKDGESVGIATPFPKLDTFIGGLRAPRYHVIAGRPGLGKTSFMVALLRHIIKAKLSPLFWTGEMLSESLVHLMIGQEKQINTMLVRDGLMDRSGWDKYNEFAAELRQGTATFDDTPAITPQQLSNTARRLHAKGQCDIVIVDYLQLMSGNGKDPRERVSHASASLKQLANELKIPVVAGAQLNRAVENRAIPKPVMSDLKETGQIEQDADFIGFLWSEQESPVTNANGVEVRDINLTIGKNRGGPAFNDIPMIYYPQYTLFVEGEKRSF